MVYDRIKRHIVPGAAKRKREEKERENGANKEKDKEKVLIVIQNDRRSYDNKVTQYEL